MSDYDDVDDMDFLPDDMEGALIQAPLASSSSSGSSSSGSRVGSSSAPFGSATPQEIQKEIRRWICVYPIYFSADQSCRRGRRIPAALSKKELTIWHLAKALERLRLPCVVEQSKMHPRAYEPTGRVRTVLKMQDLWVHARIRTRRQLFQEMAKLFDAVQPDVDAMIREQKAREAADAERIAEEMKAMGLGDLSSSMGMPPWMLPAPPGGGGPSTSDDGASPTKGGGKGKKGLSSRDGGGGGGGGGGGKGKGKGKAKK